MQTGQIFIITGGILHLLMGFFHTRFYSLFGWKNVFVKMERSQQRILYTIHLALLLLFFIMGLLSIACSGPLSMPTHTSRLVLTGLTLFWMWRAVWQIIYFRVPGSKRFHHLRKMHYTLTCFFFMLGISYLVPLVIPVS